MGKFRGCSFLSFFFFFFLLNCVQREFSEQSFAEFLFKHGKAQVVHGTAESDVVGLAFKSNRFNICKQPKQLVRPPFYFWTYG